MEQTTEQAPLSPRKRPPVWPFVLVALMAITGVVVWRVALQPRGLVESVADAGEPLVPDAGPALSLDDGDALLKRLAAGWSADPQFAKWLDAIVLRQLVAATQLVAEGSSPRAAVPFISIAGAFSVREEPLPTAPPKPKPTSKKKAPPPPPREERLFIAVESYARYDAIALTFASIDAGSAGDVWARLEPFCEVASAEISRPGTRFHDTLRAAMKRLLSVDVPEGEIEVAPKGAIYVFKDPSLESLSAAEKQLVRMGPGNARRIQAQLRVFAAHAKLDVGP